MLEISIIPFLIALNLSLEIEIVLFLIDLPTSLILLAINLTIIL